MKKNSGPLALSAGLIALYLLVKNSSGAGTLIKGGSAGGVSFVKAFQGR
jgi:hypothetical protein